MATATGSAMVEVRLFKDGDLDKEWKDIEPSSYLPVFLSGDQNEANINKRLNLMYFKRPTDLVKLRWNIQGEDDGVWLESPFNS